jgi:lipopolysaccharide biosynthesis glycosyltransferase
MSCQESLDTTRLRPSLVLASDKAYAMPLATTLRSIVEANRSSWPLEFYVLYEGLSENTRSKVFNSLPKESATIRWLLAETKVFAEFSSGGMPTETYHVPKITYTRLLIPWLLPDTVSKVLYLDSDLLVLDDLAPLWETDLGGAVVGAVSDFILHTSFVAAGFDPQLKRAEPRHQGVPRVREYFNAGVLLIDLTRWRENRISEKAMEYLKDHPKSPFMDQDALNFVCENSWKRLEPRWNFQNHQRKIVESGLGILHFVAKWKPWDARGRSYNARLYDNFRSRTLFARTPLEKLRDSVVRLWTGFTNVIKRRGLLKRSTS